MPNPTITLIYTMPYHSFVAAFASYFKLVDSDTNKEIRPLRDDDVVNLAEVGRNLNVRFVTKGNSATINYDCSSKPRCESIEPYALAGDNRGNYKKWTPKVGLHMIKAYGHSKEKCKGRRVDKYRKIFFRVIDEEVPEKERLFLFNADKSEELGPMSDFESVNLADVGKHLSVLLDTSDLLNIKSVRFRLDSDDFTYDECYNEPGPFYSTGLWGDDPDNWWRPSYGTNVVKAEGYESENCDGEPLVSQSADLTVKMPGKSMYCARVIDL